MIRANMAGVARPVRMVANSSFAWSTARSIFSSASKRVSSIISSASFGAVVHLSAARRGDGQHQGADLVAAQRLEDGVLALGGEDEHGQAILHAQAKRGG